jgi:Peptidase family M28/PA domain
MRPPASLPPEVEGPTRSVTVEGIRRHLHALQQIADRNGDSRSVGTPGYDASVAYVSAVLEAAGYRVTLPETTMPIFVQREPATLTVLGPGSGAWTDGWDLRVMVYSASADVEGEVEAVEGGCSRHDFDGFHAGDVALLDPGPCLRRDQVLNAQAAGASAVIGASTAPTGHPLRPTLLHPEGIEVPVLSVTADLARALSAGPRVRIRVRVSTTDQRIPSVIADSPSGDPEHVVMLGAHLDSVMDGPGIDDDGTGVATLLEVARWLAGRHPEASVRLAFWAGEEEGLYGSRDYVDGLSAAERDAIDEYLNLDVLGSPNFVPFVYADRPSDPSAAARSDEIARLFSRSFEDRGLEAEPYDMQGGSDHAPFMTAGIATGGLYSGTDEIKTRAQMASYGGAPGVPLDPCYHQACDTDASVSDAALVLFSAVVVVVLGALLR